MSIIQLTGVDWIRGKKKGNYSMKKLLVFAAVAAMGIGAYAGCSEEDTSVEGQVYQWKMLLKTTQGISMNIVDAPACGESSSSCIAYRIPDKVAIQGWMYACEFECDLAEGGFVTVMWDPSRKIQISTPTFDFSEGLLNILANKKAAETAWTFTGDYNYDSERKQTITLTGAGFGTFNEAMKAYTSFSGFVAGKMTASYDLRSTKGNCCEPSQVWQCASLTELVEDADTAAYGKWAMRLNPAASAAYAAHGTAALKKHSPKYVSFE